VLEKAMSTGRYPRIAALDEDAFASTGEEFFEFGLQRMVDGLAALVDRRRHWHVSRRQQQDPPRH
jgi:hypothetical protein